MIKYFCDGCGDEIKGCYSVGSTPMTDSFRFIEGMFCESCLSKGILLKKEFIDEYNNLVDKYRKKLKKKKN